MNSKHENGRYIDCPVADDWLNHTMKAEQAIKKVDTMHELLENIQQHTVHLQKLDNLDLLVEAVTGKNEQDNKLVILISKIFGVAIVGLVIVIVFLLTGQSFGWFKLH